MSIRQSMWDHLGIALPDLPYERSELEMQEKGSTAWAAHSHTPISVVEWTDFQSKIAEASRTPETTVIVDANVAGRMNEQVLKEVTREEHVTDNAETLLRTAFQTVRANLRFKQDSRFTLSSPDLIAVRLPPGKGQEAGTIPANAYSSPENRARAKREALAARTVLFTFETKPFWKFRFLFDDASQSTNFLVSRWEYPSGYTPEQIRDEDDLPEDWDRDKKKVFHLIRQAYGQMVSSKLRYGIIHLYEVWWFCSRDAEGTLKISPPVMKEATSPSVLQIIIALAGFDDLFLEEVAVHPGSAIKARDSKLKAEKRKRKDVSRGSAGGKNPPSWGGKEQGGNKLKPRSLKPCLADPTGFASRVFMWDCEVLDFNDNVKLLSTKKDPSVLIKIPHDPQAENVAEEMEREAAIYYELSGNADVENATAKFYGFSTHLGVPLLCISKEGPDFEDIGVENLSKELKRSAVESLRCLSRAGLVHRDLALRNIVQSAEDPKQAKIIDFGRAEFIEDQRLLQAQVERLESILGTNATAHSSEN